MSKNVHDVRKVCLETTVCVLTYFIEFYVFVLDQINLDVSELVYNHIRVRKFWENIPKAHPRVLEEGPMLVAKTAQGSPTYGWKTTSCGLIDAP